jgi:hypothetical protein
MSRCVEDGLKKIADRFRDTKNNDNFVKGLSAGGSGM